MLKVILLILTVCIAALAGWVIYWSGYARGMVTASYVVYDQQVADTMVSLSLRQIVMKREGDTMSCQVDTIVGSQVADLALKERDLNRSVTWRDVVGMREMDDFVRSRNRRTVQDIREKFRLGDTPPTC